MANELLGNLLTTKEVARLTGLSEAWFNARRSNPKLGGGPPYYKLSGAVRYTQADVREWLASCRVEDEELPLSQRNEVAA